MHRLGGVFADLTGCGRGMEPGGDWPRPGLRLGGERRVERVVIGGLVADDVDDRAVRPAGVMEVGEAVGEAGPAMEERRRGPAGHARIAVGGAGGDALEQGEDATDARHAVERGDEVHLAGAGIGEAGVDAAGKEGAGEAFGAVHGDAPGFTSGEAEDAARVAGPAGGACGGRMSRQSAAASVDSMELSCG